MENDIIFTDPEAVKIELKNCRKFVESQEKIIKSLKETAFYSLRMRKLDEIQIEALKNRDELLVKYINTPFFIRWFIKNPVKHLKKKNNGN